MPATKPRPALDHGSGSTDGPWLWHIYCSCNKRVALCGYDVYWGGDPVPLNADVPDSCVVCEDLSPRHTCAAEAW